MRHNVPALGLIAFLRRCMAVCLVMTVLDAVDGPPSIPSTGDVEEGACLVWLQTATDAGMPDVPRRHLPAGNLEPGTR